LADKAFLYDEVSGKLKKSEESVKKKDKQLEDLLTEIEALNQKIDEITGQKENEL